MTYLYFGQPACGRGRQASDLWRLAEQIPVIIKYYFSLKCPSQDSMEKYQNMSVALIHPKNTLFSFC